MTDTAAKTRTRVDHTGITVTDLDRSTHIWRDILGLSVARRFELTGDFAAQLTGVPNAHTTHVVLEAGTAQIELVQYLIETPGPLIADGPSARGTLHVGLLVENIADMLTALREAGCQSINEPAPIPDGARAGSEFCYVVDPDGVVIELIELKALDPA